jgi:hypothetical protein
MFTPTGLDLNSVTLHIDQPLSGFCHRFYPIYLNQGRYQPLTMSFFLTGNVNGVHMRLNPAHHQIEIIPMLRYGRTPNAVPVPEECGEILQRMQKEHDDLDVMTISFRLSGDCLSDGGFESTVRLRVLALYTPMDMVMALIDSERFAIMTRDTPTGHNLLTKLRIWGFPIHDDDEESHDALAAQMRLGTNANKRHKPMEPASFPDDEAQPSDPVAVSLPSGETKLMFKWYQQKLGMMGAVHPPPAPMIAARHLPVDVNSSAALAAVVEAAKRSINEYQLQQQHHAAGGASGGVNGSSLMSLMGHRDFAHLPDTAGMMMLPMSAPMPVGPYGVLASNSIAELDDSQSESGSSSPETPPTGQFDQIDGLFSGVLATHHIQHNLLH